MTAICVWIFLSYLYIYICVCGRVEYATQHSDPSPRQRSVYGAVNLSAVGRAQIYSESTRLLDGYCVSECVCVCVYSLIPFSLLAIAGEDVLLIVTGVLISFVTAFDACFERQLSSLYFEYRSIYEK